MRLSNEQFRRGVDRLVGGRLGNHQVVDEWQSLVNPQRPIPAKIVELTGITNQMVREAPLFHEIAESFMAFIGDGIFVAHNVNFDYGFLSYEHERHERRFRFPKPCTCVEIRRRYPGHKSYRLGTLCARDLRYRARSDDGISAEADVKYRDITFEGLLRAS